MRGSLDRVNMTPVSLGRSRHDRRCSWVTAPKVENKANQLRTQRLAFNKSRPDWVSVRRVGWRMPATDARTATARARRVAGAALSTAESSGGQLHGGRQQECIGVTRRRAARGGGPVVQPGRRTVVQRAFASSQPQARNRPRVITSGPPATSSVGCGLDRVLLVGAHLCGRSVALDSGHLIGSVNRRNVCSSRGPGVAGPCVPTTGHTGGDARRLSVSLHLHR